MKSHQHNDTRFRVFNMISLLYPCNQFGLDAVFCLLFCSCRNVNFFLHVKNVNQGFSKVFIAFAVNEYIYWTINDFTHFCHPYQFMRNPFIAHKSQKKTLSYTLYSYSYYKESYSFQDHSCYLHIHILFSAMILFRVLDLSKY